MAEYIEREALLEDIQAAVENEGMGSMVAGALKRYVKRVPAADVAPVRHGRWIEPSRLYYGAKPYECSLCCSDTFWKKHSITEKYPHCPNCGAKMDGGDGNRDMV